jgi:hypothetical protein
MVLVVLGALLAALSAGYVYLWRERLGAAGFGMAVLRTVAVAALLILLVNPGRATRLPGAAPVVLLDASLSMGVGGNWRRAVDTARVLAGPEGTILRFGSSVAPFDTTPPMAGATRLRSALYAARAAGGPVYVVSDGEIEDIAAILPNTRADMILVLLPRDTVMDVALLDLDLPGRVQRDDSIRVDFTLGVWGTNRPRRAAVEISADSRAVSLTEWELPSAPAVLRRSVAVAPGELGVGIHVVTVRVALDGDTIEGDDERRRVVTVTEHPAIVILADSPDWESRFLASELTELSGTTVSAFAHLMHNEWFDMHSLEARSQESVMLAARRSGLLVTRATESVSERLEEEPRAAWRWPAGIGSAPGFIPGDWYTRSQVPPSPLALSLGLVEWDSLPPLLGLLPLARETDGWVAVTARLGRRGVEQPVLVGSDSAGVRKLTTAGAGLWRWAFRGGAPREAYRALLAAGVDWLLGAEGDPTVHGVRATTVAVRDEPVVFEWLEGAAPDSAVLEVVPLSGGSESTAVLRFDSRGNALHVLPPGAYQWRVRGEPGARGMTVVERYSNEYLPRRVTTGSGTAGRAAALVERHARERWWLYVIVVLALAAEWIWRHERGLP